MQKSDREIMEILEALDLTRCSHSAADLAVCDPKTAARYVDARDAGADPRARGHRPMLADPVRAKIEELVERSGGRVRADVVHERLRDLDPLAPYAASERTTRRAVRSAKAAYRAGHRRTYRPWIPSPACGSSSTGARDRRSPAGRADGRPPRTRPNSARPRTSPGARRCT